MAVLKVVSVRKSSMEDMAGFKYAVVGPNKYFRPFRTKDAAARWMRTEEKRAIKAGLKVIY